MNKKVIIISICILFIFIVVLYNHFSDNEKIVLDDSSELISIFVEDNSGNYQSTNSFPGAGYLLNRSLSWCENGGTLSGDGTTVVLSSGKSDKCYLYFNTPWLNVNATKTLTCNNTSRTWDYKINGARFAVNTNADMNCTATKTANSTSQNFAAYLITLSGTTQGDGKLVNENGYRYEGKDPNNYIWFNNELWRIIGVFGSNSHGIASTNLVKIMRAHSIGAYAITGVNYNDALLPGDVYNAWAYTNLFQLLNACYYNSAETFTSAPLGDTSVYCFTNCYKYYNVDTYDEVNGACDFSYIGLKNDTAEYDYRDLIQEVTWYLGGPGKSGYTTYYPSNLYGYERTVAATPNGIEVSVIANIGLMNIADYAYSVLSTSCARGSYVTNTNAAGGYAESACAGNSWIWGEGHEWTLTANSSNSTSFWSIARAGNTSSSTLNTGANVRPVVYLKSNTYKLSGDGSITNPYVVGLSVN